MELSIFAVSPMIHYLYENMLNSEIIIYISFHMHYFYSFNRWKFKKYFICTVSLIYHLVCHKQWHFFFVVVRSLVTNVFSIHLHPVHLFVNVNLFVTEIECFLRERN